jgi:hypothetical protein
MLEEGQNKALSKIMNVMSPFSFPCSIVFCSLSDHCSLSLRMFVQLVMEANVEMFLMDSSIFVPQIKRKPIDLSQMGGDCIKQGL